MKKWIALLLLLALSVSLFGCAKEELPSGTEESTELPSTQESSSEESETTEATEESTEPSSVSETEEPDTFRASPLLYRVSDENGAVLYLFGSIHVADERSLELPDYVMNAYEESDYIAAEFDLYTYSTDFKLAMEISRRMILSDGTKTYDHLSQETFEIAKAYLKEKGMYNALYEIYHPYFLYSLVENTVVEDTGLDANLGIDMQFLTRAHEEGKEVREVESAQFQTELLLNFSDELYDFLIRYSVENAQEGVEATIGLYEAWLRGNEEELLPYLEDSESEDPKEAELYEEYSMALVTNRNLTMTETAKEYLSEGGTGFFMVGLGHIIGEGGCVDLLEQAGYTVEQVLPE